MGRGLLHRTSEFPYHITARANNKEWFYLESTKCWKIFREVLREMQSRHNIEIHAFIMMSNHIHMIVSTPNANIDKAMHYFMTTTSKRIGYFSRRINKIWGGRYYRTLITTTEYYTHAYKYLYSNPLRAGIVQKIQDYQFSTLHPKSIESVAIKHREGFDVYIPENAQELKNWINQEEDEFYIEQVRKALKKRDFKFSNTKEVKLYDSFKKKLPKK